MINCPLHGTTANGGEMIMGIILLALCIVIIFFVSKTASNGYVKVKEKTPLEILRKRYAKGEITKEDFEKMKKDIEI